MINQRSDEGHPKEDSGVSSLVTWIIGFMLVVQARRDSDSAMDALLKLICILTKILGRFSDFLRGIDQKIPSSIYNLYRTSRNNTNFTKFVVCPKCDRLYHFHQCVTTMSLYTVP